jgi:hypothetical protein
VAYDDFQARYSAAGGISTNVALWPRAVGWGDLSGKDNRNKIWCHKGMTWIQYVMRDLMEMEIVELWQCQRVNMFIYGIKSVFSLLNKTHPRPLRPLVAMMKPLILQRNSRD